METKLAFECGTCKLDFKEKIEAVDHIVETHANGGVRAHMWVGSYTQIDPDVIKTIMKKEIIERLKNKNPTGEERTGPQEEECPVDILPYIFVYSVDQMRQLMEQDTEMKYRYLMPDRIINSEEYYNFINSPWAVDYIHRYNHRNGKFGASTTVIERPDQNIENAAEPHGNPGERDQSEPEVPVPPQQIPKGRIYKKPKRMITKPKQEQKKRKDKAIHRTKIDMSAGPAPVADLNQVNITNTTSTTADWRIRPCQVNLTRLSNHNLYTHMGKRQDSLEINATHPPAAPLLEDKRSTSPTGSIGTISSLLSSVPSPASPTEENSKDGAKSQTNEKEEVHAITVNKESSSESESDSEYESESDTPDLHDIYYSMYLSQDDLEWINKNRSKMAELMEQAINIVLKNRLRIDSEENNKESDESHPTTSKHGKASTMSSMYLCHNTMCNGEVFCIRRDHKNLTQKKNNTEKDDELILDQLDCEDDPRAKVAQPLNNDSAAEENNIEPKETQAVENTGEEDKTENEINPRKIDGQPNVVTRLFSGLLEKQINEKPENCENDQSPASSTPTTAAPASPYHSNENYDNGNQNRACRHCGTVIMGGKNGLRRHLARCHKNKN